MKIARKGFHKKTVSEYPGIAFRAVAILRRIMDGDQMDWEMACEIRKVEIKLRETIIETGKR